MYVKACWMIFFPIQIVKAAGDGKLETLLEDSLECVITCIIAGVIGLAGAAGGAAISATAPEKN